jgi:hypothetical protein
MDQKHPIMADTFSEHSPERVRHAALRFQISACLHLRLIFSSRVQCADHAERMEFECKRVCPLPIAALTAEAA